MSYFETFKKEILSMSVAQTYGAACAEWFECGMREADQGEECSCICSHSIRQLITIRNRKNGNEAIVGSDCIQKIEGMPCTELYTSVLTNLAELKRDRENAKIGKPLIEFIRGKKFLEERHILFLEQLRCKRKISIKQKSYYDGLKKRITNLIKN
jgi:hypothetical protein